MRLSFLFLPLALAATACSPTGERSNPRSFRVLASDPTAPDGVFENRSARFECAEWQQGCQEADANTDCQCVRYRLVTRAFTMTFAASTPLGRTMTTGDRSLEVRAPSDYASFGTGELTLTRARRIDDWGGGYFVDLAGIFSVKIGGLTLTRGVFYSEAR
jgi:hypothetical protein